MNNEKFSLGLVLSLAFLALAGGLPHRALSAASAQQEGQYVMDVSLEPGRPCPEESTVITVDVHSNPEEFDIEHPERNGPVSVAFVAVTVKQGTIVGSSTGLTDVFGVAKFGYQAPERKKKAGIEQLDVVASWIEPSIGREVTVQKSNLYPLAQCKYEIWIVDHHAIESPWTGTAVGLAHAQVDDAGNLTGEGTMDIWGWVAMGDVKEDGHSSHKIAVKGNVSGGTANFELGFSTTESVLTVSTSEGSRQLSGWASELPNVSCQVDAFKGGKIRCLFNTFVDVVRK